MRLFLLFAGIVSGALFVAPDGFSQTAASLVQSREVGTLRKALESFANAARGRMDTMQNELDAFKKCAAKHKIYAPGGDAADANGCLSVGTNCGSYKNGQIVDVLVSTKTVCEYESHMPNEGGGFDYCVREGTKASVSIKQCVDGAIRTIDAQQEHSSR
jgi:hypothetical protein